MRFTVLGIDPGFASLGVARISSIDGKLIAESIRVVTTKKASKKARLTLRVSADDVHRARCLWDGMNEMTDGVDAVAYEVYAPFQGGEQRIAHGTKTAMACGLALALGFAANVPVIPVLPTDIKREITGRVSASKTAVCEVLVRQISQLEDLLSSIRKTKREHASDAAAVAFVGLTEAMRWHRVSRSTQSGVGLMGERQASMRSNTDRPCVIISSETSKQ